MPLDVVDRNQRQFPRPGEGLRPAHAREQRPHQPRPESHRHRVQIRHLHPRVRQRLPNEGVQRLHMHARGNLRHHAPVEGMPVDLRGDDAGQYAPPVLHDGRRRLVAGRFDGQNPGVALLPKPRGLLPRDLFIPHLVRSPQIHRDAQLASGIARTAIPIQSAVRLATAAKKGSGSSRIIKSVRGSSIHKSLSKKSA